MFLLLYVCMLHEYSLALVIIFPWFLYISSTLEHFVREIPIVT